MEYPKNTETFKLLSLELFNHKYLGDLSLNFTDIDEIKNGPYTTIIIGPNGAGKSTLLRIIVDAFRELENLYLNKPESKLVPCAYTLRYYLNGNSYKYTTNSRNELIPLTKNDKAFKPARIDLPISVIASSIMVNDSFPFVPWDQSDVYKYLGVRRSPSVAGTQTFMRKIIDLILENSNNSSFLSRCANILSFIGFEKKINIIFYPRYRNKLFTGNLTSDYLNDFFVKWQKIHPNRKTPPYGHSYFINHIKDNSKLLKEITDSINYLSISYNLHERSEFIRYDIFNENEPDKFINSIKYLSSLDLLRYPDIELKKPAKLNGNNLLNLQDISSGEYHLIASFLGIASILGNNSLILLDEPDISLHPNWQMKYISFLKDIFKEYSGCHFITATHSHFFVSDLKPINSYLLGLKRNENNVVIKADLPKDTYGWSAENILYRIFDLRSVRNFYFEIELRKLLHLISEKSHRYEEIRSILNHLQQYKLDEFDPLNEIIKQAWEYIGDADKTN